MYTLRNTLFLTPAGEHGHFLFKLKMLRQRRDLPWGITIRSACCNAPSGVEKERKREGGIGGNIYIYI